MNIPLLNQTLERLMAYKNKASLSKHYYNRMYRV